jgi:hypothetical protein
MTNAVMLWSGCWARRDSRSCEQCFELLDQYVDLEVAGADADAHLPGLRAHLDGCPACREDHESLLALVSAEGESAG